jgi:hypothetical protein
VGVILNGDLQTQTGTLLWQKFIMTLLTPRHLDTPPWHATLARHLGTPMISNPQNSFFLFLSFFKY